MVDPRGGAPTIGSGAQSPFLDALRERVLVFDGAFGTWMQGQDLGPDDFGGAALEGCNEHLVLTRPDLVSQMHDEFFEVGVDAVETATFGAFPLVLNEYGIAGQDVRDQPAARRRSPGKSRPVVLDRRTGRGSSSARSAPAPSCRRSARFATTSCATTTRLRSTACSPAASTCCSIETVYDLLQAKAAINGARARDGRGRPSTLPIMVQVTVETTGRMLVGTEIGAALTALEAMRPDVIGMNCATGPAEMTEHLRYLAQHARTFLSCLAERGAAVGRRRPHALRPHAGRARRRARAVRDRVRAQHRRRLLRHDARAPAPRSIETPRHRRAPVAAHAGVRARLLVDLLARAVPPGARVPRRSASAPTRTARRKFRDAMLEADWDTLRADGARAGEGRRARARRVRRLRRPRRHRRHGRDRGPLRDPGVRCRSCSTRPSRGVVEAGLQHHGGKAILNSANLEEGEGEGKRMDRVFRLARSTAPRSSASRSTRRARRATADWKLRVAKRIYDIAIERYGIEPTDLIFDTLTFPLSTGDDDLRRDAMETIEAIRRIKAELPGRVDDPRAVERVVRPQARGPARAQQRVPARVPRSRASTPRSCTRRASCRCTRSTTASARSRSTSSTTAVARTTTRSPSSWRCSKASRPARSRSEDRSGWPVEERLEAPHHRRRTRRPRSRSRRAARRRCPRSRSSTTCCSTA